MECVQCHKKYDGYVRFTHLVNTNDYWCEFCLKYDQPERSKGEDFKKLADEFLESTDSKNSGRGGNWETENGYFLAIEEYSRWLNQRFGSLNTMETE